MTYLNIKLTCNNCRAKVSADEIRYALDGVNVICLDCYNKQHTKVSLSSGIAERRRKRVVLSRVYEKYYCNYCKRCFELKKNSDFAKRCPYCSSIDVYTNSEITADRLVENSER